MQSLSPQSDIRFGGHEIDGVFHYELTGGRLCLDLVNTFQEREGEGHELLSSYGRLLEWSVQAGALTNETVTALRKAAIRAPSLTGQALDEVRAFRELLFLLLREITSGEPPSKRHLDVCNSFLAKSGERRRLAFTNGRLEIAPEKDDLLAPLWPVVEDAAELLLDRQLLGRLRICEGHGCTWMFIDRSRRSNRRWCDMSVCGNRAKARRHRSASRNKKAAGV